MQQKVEILIEKKKAEYIKNIIAKYYNFDMEVYKYRGRAKQFIKPRQVACYFCKKYTTLTFQEIGNLFMAYNHATVIFTINAIDDQSYTDLKFREEINKIDEILSLSLSSVESFYSIEMASFHSVKLNVNKAIIFVGHTLVEINKFVSDNNISGNVREHVNPGLYLLD